MDEPVSPTRHQLDIKFANMKLMKQQILDIRQRKQALPKVPEPLIVKSFEQLYRLKANQIRKRIISKRIQQKKKQFQKINNELQKYKQKYSEKEKSFKQKQHIFKVLTQKLQTQFDKTKATFRDVGFNRSITSGVRKLNYYRVGQILFNENARRVFYAIENSMQSSKDNSQSKSEEQVGICLGYLGLLISIVGEISGGRLWFDFVFKGSKSAVKLNDGLYVTLRPRQTRFSQGINILTQQLFQIMHECMGLKIQRSKNLYQMCQQLSKAILN